MRKLKLNKESKKDLLDTLLKRSPNHYRSYEGQVAEILNEVREKKDMALFSEDSSRPVTENDLYKLSVMVLNALVDVKKAFE